jgi:hypothetical protein
MCNWAIFQNYDGADESCGLQGSGPKSQPRLSRRDPLPGDQSIHRSPQGIYKEWEDMAKLVIAGYEKGFRRRMGDVRGVAVGRR